MQVLSNPHFTKTGTTIVGLIYKVNLKQKFPLANKIILTINKTEWNRPRSRYKSHRWYHSCRKEL